MVHVVNGRLKFIWIYRILIVLSNVSAKLGSHAVFMCDSHVFGAAHGSHFMQT
jgi:hypothetical protein